MKSVGKERKEAARLLTVEQAKWEISAVVELPEEDVSSVTMKAVE